MRITSTESLPSLVTRTARRLDHLGTGLQALRLLVVLCLILDAGTGIIGQAYGRESLGTSGVLAASVGVCLVVLVAIGVLWRLPRLAIVCSIALAILNYTVVTTGEEVWLLLIIGVVYGATARPRQLAMIFGAVVAYAVAFAMSVEGRRPGFGWTTVPLTIAIAAAGLAIGLVARTLLKSHAARVGRLAAYRRDNAAIRAAERNRLADELQAIIVEVMTSITNEIDGTPAGSTTSSQWRRLLTRIDERTRTVLADLRTLLEVLRREQVDRLPGARLPRARVKAIHDPLAPVGIAQVRFAGAAILLILAGYSVVTGPGSTTDPDVVIRTLGLIACAVALHRPAVGAAAAVGTIVLSVIIAPTRPWDAIPLAALCLIGALSVSGARRIYLIGAALIGYGSLLYALGRTDALDLLTRGYVIAFLLLIGLAIRHFRRLRTSTDHQQGVLTAERDTIGTQERTAVARELHDIVAHQLSLSTLHVMATSLSEDAATLAATAAKVRQSTEAARSELGTLLHAMRGADSERARPGPLVTPLSCATALTDELTANGFLLVTRIDPATDGLDPAAQRTLTRIMQEGATNILRYTPAPATCDCTITIDSAQVSLTITSPLGAPAARSRLSLGWGLRGIRERVDLTHGTFSAAPIGDSWVIHVTLPATRGFLAAPEPDPPQLPKTRTAPAKVGVSAVCGPSNISQPW